MIQFNLLPEVKMQLVRARRTQRLVVAGSVLISAVALLAFMSSLVIADVLQKKHLNDLDSDLKTAQTAITTTPDLDKVLTVQNQLSSIPALNAQKPATNRLFSYLQQLTPNGVKLSMLDIDYTAHTVSMSGAADSIATVNKFVDTLKFTNYGIGSDKPATPAFKTVVLSGFGNNKDDNTTSYSISFTFDPVIFDATKQVSLSVPDIISTRSETEQPNALFGGSTTTTNGGN